MVDAPTESRAMLHIVHHLDWQREGQHTVDIQRAKLLDLLAHIAEMKDDERPIALGSETILLDDAITINHDILSALVTHRERFNIGPWYIHLDGLLATGESYIRSLLLAQADSTRYNIPLNPIALLPDNSQSPSQLPQILQGFGISAALSQVDQMILPLPFGWQAPDGSQVLMTTHPISLHHKRSQLTSAEGIHLWIHHIESDALDVNIPADAALELAIHSTTLVEFVQAQRAYLPDDFRPVMRGELHLRPLAETAGRFSARISYKQEIMYLVAQLNYLTEPLLALAVTFGQIEFPAIQQSLVNHSWRLLLQNLSPKTLAGAVSDDTHEEIVIRNRRVADVASGVIDHALQGLPGTPEQSHRIRANLSETYITVWNPHGHAVQQLVDLVLTLPQGMHPNVLLTSADDEQPFTWDSETRTLNFLASVPAIGYRVYRLQISREKTAAYNQRRIVAGRSIGGASGESLGLVGGRLDWTFANGHVIDLLNYYDGGDAGDVWRYQPPEKDLVMRASIVDVVQVEATPTYERLIFRNRMRIAPGLKDGTSRERGLRVLDLTTQATYHNGLPGIHIKTQFNNPAEDHRLRAHLRTAIKSDAIYTGGAFDQVKRPIHAGSGDLPLQGMATIFDNKRGFSIFTRGLSAIEPLIEDDQVTLALSLMRAVGWLNKREGIRTHGTQMNGEFSTEFMLIPHEEFNPAELSRTQMSYQRPLYAMQYQEKPPQDQHSYLSLDGEQVVMSTLKMSESGDGLLVRLVNTANTDSVLRLHSAQELRTVSQVTLAEAHQADIVPQGKQVQVTLRPHQILSLNLRF
ncbi:MAG: glycosyl hydrolase-related protein [Anaerolineae bacterium]